MALAACLASTSTGCVGPKAIGLTRMRYNEAYRVTNDEQLLTNIVRLRYADSPVFIDLPGITSQLELAGGSSYGGLNQSVSSEFGYGGFAARDTPTLSYHPREGREIARALLNPLTAELFSVVNAGANTEQLLLLTLNDINDVPNAPRATTMTPRSPDDNSEFLRGVRLITTLLERGGIEIAIGASEESDVSSDPIPLAQVRGRDLIDAAKDGYVYRTQGDSRVTLLKREKGLVMRVRPEFVETPEMQELCQVFRMTPGLTAYKIKSELTDDANRREPDPINDTIFLNLRSVLQMMVFLSKGVCVPPEHVVSGVAPTTRGPDGQPFDWTHITAGNFQVASQKHRPKDAEVAVYYRDYWYYIRKNDVNSRAVLAVLEILAALQESDTKSGGPLLTLPVGG
ncbi:MAG: hypothetical protein U0835_05860 [Isosphaeraceae bacterium]